MNKILLDKVQHRLKEKEMKFRVIDDVIHMNMNIGGVVGKLSMIIDIYDDAYITYAIMSSSVSAEHIDAVSEYLHRANFGLLHGNFELDYDDGEVRYKLITHCDENRISNRVIDRSILVPCVMFEKYGNGIISLMLGVGNPKELIDEIEKPKGE